MWLGVAFATLVMGTAVPGSVAALDRLPTSLRTRQVPMHSHFPRSRARLTVCAGVRQGRGRPHICKSHSHLRAGGVGVFGLIFRRGIKAQGRRVVCLKPHGWKVAVTSQARACGTRSPVSGPGSGATDKQYRAAWFQIALVSGRDLGTLAHAGAGGPRVWASRHQHASSLWSQQAAAPLLTAAEI